MKKPPYLFISLLLCFLLFACAQKLQKTVEPAQETSLKHPIFPAALGVINDFENIFTKQEIQVLDSLIIDFERRTTIEIAIATLDKNQCSPKDFDDYTLTLANAWEIGKREKNNGILIAISQQFHQIRIQNGKGIENIMSDGETKKLIDQNFLPYFRNESYFDGTKNGLRALTTILQEKQEKYNAANVLIDTIIALIQQNNTVALRQLSSEKMYCYLCFDATLEDEPYIDKTTFYDKLFNTIFDDELVTRLRRNEKQIFITHDDEYLPNNNAIIVLYTTYRNNEFGDGHEGAQFAFWLKEENGTLKLTGMETIP